MELSYTATLSISIHAPVKGATKISGQSVPSGLLFQSTHP